VAKRVGKEIKDWLNEGLPVPATSSTGSMAGSDPRLCRVLGKGPSSHDADSRRRAKTAPKTAKKRKTPRGKVVEVSPLTLAKMKEIESMLPEGCQLVILSEAGARDLLHEEFSRYLSAGNTEVSDMK
jgi:hypothetical protein